jgi:hypothetical protein
MKKPKFYVPVILLGLVGVGVIAYAAYLALRVNQQVLGAEPKTAEVASAQKIVQERFAKSATSIARPDLLACSNLDAKFSQPMDGEPGDLATMLNGVWLGRRTVHGVTIEMDTAFYIKMEGTTGSAILIDRNNLGRSHFDIPFSSAQLSPPKQPLMLSFVNCGLQFLDQYVKVADSIEGVPMAILANATKTSIAASTDLKEVWNEIVTTGYFNSLGERQTAKLGDGTRLAVLPNGASATETAIEGGSLPGSESYLPTLVGAYFKINLTSKVVGAQRGVSMKWFGEYRGAGVNLAPGALMSGIEAGDFFREGGAFVSTVPSAFATSGADQWATTECGDKAEVAVDPTTTGTVTMMFDRVVIGAP